MTRINAGMPPRELCDKHLNGERFEITRVPNGLLKGTFKANNIPTTFKLGTGHVKFFYDKIKYLHKRYDDLTTESIARGFNITYDPTPFLEIKKQRPELYNDWVECNSCKMIILSRLKEKYETIKNIKWTQPIINSETLLKINEVKEFANR